MRIITVSLWYTNVLVKQIAEDGMGDGNGRNAEKRKLCQTRELQVGPRRRHPGEEQRPDDECTAEVTHAPVEHDVGECADGDEARKP